MKNERVKIRKFQKSQYKKNQVEIYERFLVFPFIEFGITLPGKVVY